MKFDSQKIAYMSTAREMAREILRPLIIFQVVFLALIAIGVFAGHPGRYPDVYWLFSDPTLFANDPILNDSAVIKGTSFFALVHSLGIKLELSVHALIFQAIFAMVAVIFCVRLLLRHFSIPSIEASLTIVIVSCFLTNEFFVSTDPSILSGSGANHCFVAYVLTFPFLYYLLADRFLFAAAFLLAALFVSLPGTFLLVAVSGIYVLLHRGAQRRSAWFLLLPAVYLLYRMLNSHVPTMSPAQALDLTREIINFPDFRGLMFARQGLETAAILIATFLLFPFVVRKLESPSVRAFGWATWACSIVIFAVQIAYTQYLYVYFPSPFFLYLFLSNPLNLYSLFLALSILVIALMSPSLGWHEKIAVCMFIILLHGDFHSLMLAAAFPIILIALPRIVMGVVGPAGNPAARLSWFSTQIRAIGFPAVATLVFFAYFVARIPFSFGGFHQFDVPMYRNLGIWTAKRFISEGTWKSYKALAAVPENFPLIPIYRPYRQIGPDYRETTSYLNVVARKPRVMSYPEHALFRVDFLRELRTRGSMVNSIVDAINARREIGHDVIQFLRSNAIRVMVPAAVADLFPHPASKRQFDEMILIGY